MNNWKLSDLIGDYEESDLMPAVKGELPIPAPEPNAWTKKENPERLVRIFKIKDESKFNSFIMDLLELQSETGHHARLTVQHPQAKIEVWTHTLMAITEIDIEWTKKATEIYEGYE